MKRPATRIRDEPATDWTTLSSDVDVRRVVEGNGCSINLYRLGSGTRFDQHGHTFSELGVMLVGEGSLLIVDQERVLAPGDSFFIPAGTPHGFEVGSGGPVMTMNVNVPPLPGTGGPSPDEILTWAKKAAGPVAGEK